MLKKLVSLILAVFLLLTCSLPAFAFIGEVTFTDPESGAQFTIPPGWNQEQVNDDGSVFSPTWTTMETCWAALSTTVLI